MRTLGFYATALVISMSLFVSFGGIGSATDLTWDGVNGDKAPDGWDLHRSAESKGTIHVEDGALALTAEIGRYAHLDRQLKGMDGSDETPLRVECSVAIDDGAGIGDRPAMIALYWGGAASIGIGIGDGGEKGREGDAVRRRAWLCTVVGGKAEQKPTEAWFYPGQAAGHLRLVATARDVSAFASKDGWSWQRVASFERTKDFSGPPERVIVGRGWSPEKDAKPFLDNDGTPGTTPGKTADLFVYSFSQLLVSNSPPSVPAALLKTYQKKESLEETMDTIAAAGAVRQWMVLGPLAASPKAYGPETAYDPTATLEVIGPKKGWNPFVPGESPTDRIIILSDVIPGAGPDSVRFAEATIVADAPRLERFLFDGMREIRLYLNGREIAQDRRDNGEVQLERLSVTAPLRKGENHLVVKLLSGQTSRAVFTLRHENGDPRYRIALLKRLAIDFAEEGEGLISSQLEISRLWENQGFVREAAAALDEVAKNAEASPEQIDAALIERARLHRALRDEAKVSSDVEELTKRWVEGSGTDPVAARLKAAHLWERMEQPAKAAEALEQAATAAGVDAEQQVEIGLERARVHFRLGDQDAITADLRSIAKRLPETDPRRIDFLVAAIQRDVRATKPVDDALGGIDVTKASATALRNLAALNLKRNDAPRRLAALKALAASPAQMAIDAADVACAEAIIAAKGDDKQAAELYRKAISALPSATLPGVEARVKAGTGADPKALGALRSAWVRATLADTEAGAALLAEIDTISAAGSKARPLPSEVRSFAVAGPIDNANWRCYEAAFLDQNVHPSKVDITKPVEGKPWQVPGPQFWGNGYLDIAAMYNPGNCCAFAYTEIDVVDDVDTELSMGADDGLVLWFNGEKKHEDRDQRGVTPDSIVIPVHFKKGKNSILAMIQQGGGGWGFQFRIKGGTSAGDIAGALSLLDAHPEARADAVPSLAAAFENLIRSDRYAQGVALGRMIIRAFPDFSATQFTVAWRLAEQAKVHNDAATLADIPACIDSSTEALVPERDVQVRDLRYNVGSQLSEWGRFDAGMTTLRSLMRTQFDWATQVLSLYGLGELYRHAGYPRLAASFYTKAVALGVTDDWWVRTLHEAQMRVRLPKGEKAMFEISFEANALLRTADRAAASGDVERAVVSYQKAIEDFGPQLCQSANGRYLSVSGYCAQRIRALGDVAIASYGEHFDGRAKAMLEAASVEGQPDAFERVALAYPLAKSSASALSQAADGYLDAGAWSLALATFERLLAESSDPELPRPLLLAKAARAAAGAGDRAGFARIKAALEKIGGVLTIGGKAVDAKIYLGEAARLLPAPPAAAADPVITTTSILATFPVPVIDMRDARRFSYGKDVQIACRPAIDHGVAYIHTLEDSFALDLATGGLRWRAAVNFPALRHPHRSASFLGLPEATTALGGGKALVRVARGRSMVIDARDAGTGAMAWSTEGIPQLAGMYASSSPTIADGRVYALFVDQNRAYAAAFALESGNLLWLSPVTSRRATLPVSADLEVFVGGNAAPPTCVGRDLYVATDLGAVSCIDAANGAVRWVATYPRAVLDWTDWSALLPLMNRAPTRVLADESRIYLAPHDSLSVISFQRGSGDPAWKIELSECRQILGFAGAGRLLLQGQGLEAVDAATGARVWRWQPRAGDGPTLGTAAIGASSIYVATPKGLSRVAIASGMTEDFRTWKDLGSGGLIPGNLQIVGDGLIGTGNGVVVSLSSGKGAVVQPVRVAGGLARDVTISAATLPAAPPGSPLGLSWNLGGEAVEKIERPPGCAPGECFVRFEQSIARVDVANRKVLWRAPITSDVRWCTYNKGMVLIVHRFSLTALDRETGELLWMADIGDYFLDALKEDGDPPVVVLGEDAVLVYRVYWHRSVSILSLATGANIGRFDLDGGVLAATTKGGHVFTAVRRDNAVYIDERDLARPGGQLAAHEMQKPGDRDNATLVGTDAIIVQNAGQATRFDLATKKAAPFPFPFLWGYFFEEEGKTLAYCYTKEDRWVSAVIDPATGQAQFQEITAGGNGTWDQKHLYAFHLNHGHLVRFEWERKGKNGIIGKNLADAKEAWFVEGREGWNMKYHEQVMLDKYVVIFRTQAEGSFDYQVIDTETGQVSATGQAPGWPEDEGMPAMSLAGVVLYGTQQGLFALVPTTPEAARESSGGEGSVSAQAMSKLSVLPAPGDMAIDGNLDDWKDVVGVDIASAADVRVIGDSPAKGAKRWSGPMDCSAKARVCYDAANVYVSVHVADDRHVDPVPGASLLTGDCVLLGIDPQEERFRGSASPLTLALALVDGRPQMTVLSGAFASAPADGQANDQSADRATMRIAADAVGMVYEIALPWTSLRANPAKRPGDLKGMRIGVAVIDWDGDAPASAMEMGHGLVHGIDQSLWRPCIFTTDKSDLDGMAFSLCDGRATWGKAGSFRGKKETVWIEDALPKGANPASDGGDDWKWVKVDPPPFSGSQSHQSNIGVGEHQHFFTSTAPLRLKGGETLFAYVYLDPKNPPTEILLQWNKGGSWEHRAYWGENKLGWGGDGSPARHPMGPLPPTGTWVRLEIPVEAVGLE